MFLKLIHCLFFMLVYQSLLSQPDSNTAIRLDFNGHQITENDTSIIIKPVGVNLVEDRFGNKQSALFTHGHANSYLNLGSSNLLKPKNVTISMWVNLQSVIYFGKGFVTNPLLIIKNAPGEDFIHAYAMAYNFEAKRFAVQASVDSLHDVAIYSKEIILINSWYHLVVTSDSSYFSFYLNGELQGKMIKGFASTFFEGDSVIVGRSTGTKNKRYTNAIFDDIRIFHRVLSEKEILELYHEPNPNRFKIIMTELLKYGSIVFVLGIVIVIILIRNNRKLKRQKEHYELHNRINELEIKAIKTQMNPHFISNAMAAIQELIYCSEYKKANRYIAKLGFLMRQILDYSDKNYISLEEELSIIKLNVELEQLRFDNNFSFHITVEEGIDLNDVMIPSLITQPFIENAIWHGLLPLKHRAPQLDVHVYTKHGTTFISIEDNGVGRAISRSDKNSKGTKLVIDKIEAINRLNNNTDFRLEITDLFDAHQNPTGTKIIIQLLNTHDE